MTRLASLATCALIVTALSFGLPGATTSFLDGPSAWASGRDDPDDGPDFDDYDNSGPGNGDWEPDDNDDYDSSGHGGGDDFDDEPDDDSNSGPGGGGDDGRDEHDASRDIRGADHAQAQLIEHVLYSIEYDEDWGEYLPREVVLIGHAEDVRTARRLGFRRLSTRRLTSGGVMVRLRIPSRTPIPEALTILRHAAPQALVTPNSIYRGSQSSSATLTPRRSPAPVRLQGTLGIIDTGVDPNTLPVSNALLSQRAFAGPRSVARTHGSAVAAIAIENGVRVHIADVFGESTDGALAASAERIAAALDWMIANRVAVVNISVQGPSNAILEEMVRRAVDRGHIIVAAAGNGGPTARPTFPGAFDGVLAITAIDADGQPYIRANRGDYIDFAAFGVDVPVNLQNEAMHVTGTSFAAPVIAARVAKDLRTPSPTRAIAIIADLQRRADDLGEPGHDNIFGWGVLRD